MEDQVGKYKKISYLKRFAHESGIEKAFLNFVINTIEQLYKVLFM